MKNNKKDETKLKKKKLEYIGRNIQSFNKQYICVQVFIDMEVRMLSVCTSNENEKERIDEED